MTKKRYDNHSTEFGLWLREQDSLDSTLGFTATNVDFIWRNYESGAWMLIEEKRYLTNVKFPQTEMFKILHNSIQDDKYYGFHVLIFEKTNPDDGKIFWDGGEINKETLIKILKFNFDEYGGFYYKLSYFNKYNTKVIINE